MLELSIARAQMRTISPWSAGFGVIVYVNTGAGLA